MSNSPGWPEVPYRHSSSLLTIAEAEIRRLSFWAAIILPMVYLPLIAIDHYWVNEFPNFVTLLSLHFAVIWFGMQHGSSDL